MSGSGGKVDQEQDFFISGKKIYFVHQADLRKFLITISCLFIKESGEGCFKKQFQKLCSSSRFCGVFFLLFLMYKSKTGVESIV